MYFYPKNTIVNIPYKRGDILRLASTRVGRKKDIVYHLAYRLFESIPNYQFLYQHISIIIFIWSNILDIYLIKTQTETIQLRNRE